MEKSAKASVLFFLLLSCCILQPSQALTWCETIGMAAGAVGAVVAAPVVLPALGFTSAGIAAGSVAAGVQSAMGAVSAGGAFAAMQSAGAAGVGVAGKAVIAGAGAAAGHYLGGKSCVDKSKDEC